MQWSFMTEIMSDEAFGEKGSWGFGEKHGKGKHRKENVED